MPHPRTTKGLAKRISLDYFQRPHWLRTLRSALGWGCAFCAALAGIGIVAGPGRRAIVPGPVSAAHALIESDCSRCHGGFASGSSARAAMDGACSVCHEGTIHQAAQAFTPPCADCHREHRGRSSPPVRDAACLECHATSSALQPVHGFGEGDHPEFSAQRAGPVPGPGDGGEPGRDAVTRVHLNHRVHLASGLRGATGTVTLRCASCHVPDASGQAMLPAEYEPHCASCHPLAFDKEGRFPPGTVAPHARPAVVRAFLLDLYGETEPLRQVAVAEEILFRKDCRLCHDFDDTTPGARPAAGPEVRSVAAALPEMIPTGVPRTWLPKARFDHRTHRLLACAACHAQAPASEETADLLLPAIGACRECHRPEASGGDSFDPSAGAARADCVLCHAYHDRSRERDPDGPLGLKLESAAALRPQPALQPAPAVQEAAR